MLGVAASMRSPLAGGEATPSVVTGGPSDRTKFPLSKALLMRRRFVSTVLLSLFALQLGTESLMLRAADKKPVEPGAVDKDAPQEFSSTKSGLKYRIRRKGAGQKPATQDTVSVHYKGWLDNGKEFDSSYGRGESIEFPLKQVIPGWTEGMQLVGKGGMIELEIPSKLGYGAKGTQGIPGGSTLHFLVELIAVK